MNTAGKLFSIFCFLMFTLHGIYAQEESAGIHAPPWKMAVLKKSGLAYESVPFHRPLSMTRRDAYRLYLAFEEGGYCYVIQEDDEGRLPLVYRKTVSPGDRITLPEDALREGPEDALREGPEEDRDFKAGDLPGTNRLYVIVSAQSRQTLERLIEQHGKESSKETTASSGTTVPVVSLERSLLSEILAIRRSVFSSPEVPEVSSVSPAEMDPVMKGELRLFEGRDTWVITITVRVQ